MVLRGKLMAWLFLGIVAVAIGITDWRLRTADALRPDVGESLAPSYRREAVLPLAWRVARRIAISPLLWTGVIGAVILAIVEGRPAYPRALIGGWTMPADIGLFAAVYVAAGRGRSQVSIPTGHQRARTAALLYGAAALGLALGLVSLVVVALLIGPAGVFDGWRAHPLEFAQAVAVPVVMATLAVASSRWWPHPAGAAAVLIVVLFSPLSWGLDLHHVTGRGGWVATDPNSLATDELAWHLLFLVGLTALAVGLALLRHDRRFPHLTVTVFGACALALGALTPGI